MRVRIFRVFLSTICASLFACGGGQSTGAMSSGTVAPPAVPTALTQAIIDLPGRRFDYTFSRSPNGLVLTEKESGLVHIYAGSPRIRFTGVRLADANIPNTLFFSGAEIDSAVAEKVAPLTDANLNALMELYVAFFNRIPDAKGLLYWTEQLKSGVSLQQIADRFYVAASLYPNLTGYTKDLADADFVRIVYKNVLGRDSVDAEGLSYWTSQIASGQTTRGRMVVDVLNAAHTFKSHPLFGKVADLLDNKIAVARFFAVEQGFSYDNDTDNIKAGMAVANAVTDSDIETAKTMIGFNDNGLYTSLVALSKPGTAPLRLNFSSAEFEALANQKAQLGFALQTMRSLNASLYALFVKNFAKSERFSYKLVNVAATPAQQQDIFNRWGSAGYKVLFQLPFSDGPRFVLLKREGDLGLYRYRLDVAANGVAAMVAQFNLQSKDGYRYDSQVLFGEELNIVFLDDSGGSARFNYQTAPLNCCVKEFTAMSNQFARDGYELILVRTIQLEPSAIYLKNTTTPSNTLYDVGPGADDFTLFLEQLREKNSQGKRYLLSNALTRIDSSGGVVDSYFNLYIKN